MFQSLFKLIFPFILFGVSSCNRSSFDGKIYHSPSFSFQVGKLNADWTSLDADEATLAFRNVSKKAVISIFGQCGQSKEDVPLIALTKHLFLRFTDVNLQTQTLVPFNEREALHTVVLARLDGVQKTFDVWVLKKDGCVYDIALISEPEFYSDLKDEFEQFALQFVTL